MFGFQTSWFDQYPTSKTQIPAQNQTMSDIRNPQTLSKNERYNLLFSLHFFLQFGHVNGMEIVEQTFHRCYRQLQLGLANRSSHTILWITSNTLWNKKILIE